MFLSFDEFVLDLDHEAGLEFAVFLGTGVDVVGFVLVDGVDLYVSL